MYLNIAEEEDRKMAESWKGDADGMLVFVRLCPTSHAFAYNIKKYRPVCSLLQLRHCSR